MSGRPVRITFLANGRQAKAEIAAVASSVDKVGAGAKKLAALFGASIAVGGLVRAGKEVLGEASKYQSAITLLQTAGGEAQKNLGAVSKGLLKISDEVGTSADDLAEGMYVMEKAGLRGAAGLKTLRLAAQGARAEGVDLNTMATAVTSVMTSYHKGAGQAASVVNQLIVASGEAKTSMQSFAGSLAAVLPSASAAGISFAQVGAAIATLTQHGTSADEATQELANTIRNLQAPNNVASQEMQQLGLNVTNVSKNLGKRGLTGTIELLVDTITHKMGKSGLVLLDAFRKSQSAGADLQIMLKQMPKPLREVSQEFLNGKRSLKDYTADVKGFGGRAAAMGTQFKGLVTSSRGFNNLLKSGNPAAQTFTDALKKMLGGATGMNTALQLSGENMSAFKERVKEIDAAQKKNGKDVSTWAKTAGNASTQWARLTNTVRNAGISLGLAALPKLTAGVKALADGLERDAPRIKAWAKDTFGPWKPAMAAVGKLVTDTFKSIQGSGSSSVFGTLSNTIKAAAKIVEAFAKALDAIPAPMKKVAVEVAGGALALGLLTKATNAFTGSKMVTSLTAMRGGLKSYVADLRTTMAASGTFGPQTEQVAAAQSRLAAQYQKVGAAARTAAGIGGVLLLVNSMKQTSTTAGALQGVLGGVAAGFAVGGPWGAAIGGAAGLLGGIFSAKSNRAKAAQQALAAQMQATKEAAAEQKARISDLVDTLNQYTGATTVATRTKILDHLTGTDDGKAAIAAFNQLGVSTYTLISAIEGIPSATKQTDAAWASMNATLANLQGGMARLTQLNNSNVGSYQNFVALGPSVTKNFDFWTDGTIRLNAAGNAHVAQLQSQINHYQGLASAIGTALGDQKGAIASFRQTAQAAGITNRNLQISKKEWNSWPKSVRTEIKTNFPLVLNGPVGLKAFAKQVKLTPRQIRVIAKFDHLDLAKAQINALSKSFKALPKTGTVSGQGTVKGFNEAINRGGAQWGTTIKSNVSHASTSASGTASSGGLSVGGNYGAGVRLGIARWTDPIANEARAQILTAIAAAKNAQDSHSPSRKTRDLVGKPFAQGIALGINQGSAGVSSAARKMVQHALDWAIGGVKISHAQALVKKLVTSLTGANISGGAGGLLGQLNGIFSSIKGSIDAAIKDQKKQAAADKRLAANRSAILRSLKDEKSALRDIGKQQDRNNALIDAQKQKIAGIKSAMVSLKQSIADSVASFTDITSFGVNQDTGAVSFSGLVTQMQAATATTQKWAAGIKQLAKMGLNKALLQQLIAGGPGDYPTVLAILGAGKAGITQVNALQVAGSNAAKSLGNFAANDFYAAGLQAANGLLAGLKAKDKELRQAAKRIADSIVAEIKKALGIHSPSTVFRELGKFSVQGLAIGLDSTYVRSQGERISKDLLIGFGTPALQASASLGASAVAANRQQTILVELEPKHVDQLVMGKRITGSASTVNSLGKRTVRAR